ncbi:hypothetical protein ACOMHN_064775 [Nucella lapillus]
MSRKEKSESGLIGQQVVTQQAPRTQFPRPTGFRKRGDFNTFQQEQSANRSFSFPEQQYQYSDTSARPSRNRATSKKSGGLPLTTGTVNGFQVSVLRDSGATTAGVRKALVRPDQYVGRSQRVISFGGNLEVFPLARVEVDTEYFSGRVTCCVIDEPVADLILGNMVGVGPITGLLLGDIPQVAAAAETRAQTRSIQKSPGDLKIPLADLSLSTNQLISLQTQDETLQRFQKMADNGERMTAGKNSHSFKRENGVLFRSFKKSDVQISQIVTPAAVRDKVLFAAHDGLLAGHCGVRKTRFRVQNRFWWPGIVRDVQMYCRSCDICQKCSAKGRTPDVPLEQMPRIDVPFSRVAVDIVGPFAPPSEEKHRYLLTVVDVATRYPEAIPLCKIDSVLVAEALFGIFCRLGFPTEILSDNGSQFTSEMFKQFVRLLSIKQKHSSPYHAQSNGVVERFHGTLKPMIKKMIKDDPKQWHRHVAPLLFACRELPNVSTGFSPFELLFGRRPRGPVDFLADAWLESENVEEAKNVMTYVHELRNNIVDMCKLAQDSVEQAGRVQKKYHDSKAKARSFQVKDEVLVFLPSLTNKLLMTWKGPYTVVECLECDYVIDMGGKHKIFHPNMLKMYHRLECASTGEVVLPHVEGQCVPFREIVADTFCHQHMTGAVTGAEDNVVQVQSAQVLALVAVLPAEEEGEGLAHLPIPTLDVGTQETYRDVHYAETLSAKQKADLAGVFSGYVSILTSNPGCCTMSIVLT